ncbi:hypothetical protein COCNU_06G007610 [Cocos nucifera]|uniref:Uncharacterized protein n=1 Tax=Cocos nucifera TaxID=13894 RepID=A0A8K0IBR1_COCNU|nr:hypothetical protein COCNU_06G007610 [Cocos nucifera]
MAHWPRKTPTSSTANETLMDSKSINIHVPLEESALTNPILAKQLIEAILLPSDKKSRKGRTLNDMFLSFYTSFIEVVHDMVELDRFMRNFTEVCLDWKNKAMAVVREKNAILQHLQAATIKIKKMEEMEKKKNAEISHLKTELGSVQGARSWRKLKVDDVPIDQAAPKALIKEPIAASEPPSIEEEMASTMAVINAIVVDD